jgi:hypothetical protein
MQPQKPDINKSKAISIAYRNAVEAVRLEPVEAGRALLHDLLGLGRSHHFLPPIKIRNRTGILAITSKATLRMRHRERERKNNTDCLILAPASWMVRMP